MSVPATAASRAASAAPRPRIAVLQLIDSLDAGGAESMAVHLANALPEDRFASHLCSTRRDGALARRVAGHVGRLRLERRGRFDIAAVGRLLRYIREQKIDILHAHGTSLFLAALAARLRPRPSLVWHDHFGTWGTERRRTWLYGPVVRGADAVLAVNETLADWARGDLRVRADRVRYLPNFVPEPPALPPAVLAGVPGSRIVCLANFRPQKGHSILLEAMEAVAHRHPKAHLFLVGREGDPAYAARLRGEIRARGLESCVSWLGEREDVPEVLRACDVGVLASHSEGLPLALIEYGMAGLAVVATRVGQCADVLASGEAGLLVAAGDAAALGEALIRTLDDEGLRRRLASRLAARSRSVYGEPAILPEICALYEALASRRQGPR